MIYILCPAHFATGGTEVLHQLGYKLNLFGYQATMFYFNRQPNVDPVCEQYRKYAVPYTEVLVKSPENIVIIPEISISIIHQLKDFRCIIWWLSVDNAHYDEYDIEYMRNNTNILHLVQSKYALDFLESELKVAGNIFYLSDYLNSEFFSFTAQDKDSKYRQDTVLFNPRKGINKTVELIANSDYRINWKALSGLTPDGMRRVMKNAKIYIDFGNHPGKDRIPREAAVCGCCVITNKNGSAKNIEDISIPECYKFSEDTNIKEILECIYQVLEYYEERKQDFLPYVNKIFNEFIEFEKDIIKIMKNIMGEGMEVLSPEEYIENIIQFIEIGRYNLALRYLIEYRINNYEESLIIDILETSIRIGICEYQEAEMCASRGLQKDSENYELYLNLAQIKFLTGQNEMCIEYCKKAKKFSEGTRDEEYIRDVCEKEYGII